MSDGLKTYHYRVNGRVIASCADPLQVRRAIACQKLVRGEPLGELEQAELDALKGLDKPAHHVATVGDVDAELGLLLHLAPDALCAVDGIAEQIEEQLGLPAISVWPVLIEYARRAYRVALDEQGVTAACVIAALMSHPEVEPGPAIDGSRDGWTEANALPLEMEVTER